MIQAFITSILIGLLSLAGCGTGKQTESEKAPIITPERTAKVERAQKQIEVAGTVRAADVAQLASRFGGFITSLPAKAGMTVKKGTVLVSLDDRNLVAQRQKAAAAKEEARKSADAAQAQRRLATNTFERIQGLYEKKSASLQEFEEAQSRKQAADAAYLAGLQRVAQAESDAKDIAASLEYLRIVAPFDGTVTAVAADSGAFVNPGQTIVTMENPANYEVLFSVEEDLLGAVATGRQILASIPVLSNDRWTARVEEVNTATDAGTKTFLVKAKLPSMPGIRSGLSARVFLKSDAGASLWIPAEFLQQRDDIETVLVKEAAGWRRILVKSGRKENGKAEILAGLNEDDEVGLAEKKR